MGGNLELARTTIGDMSVLLGLLDDEVVLDTRAYTLLDVPAGVIKGKQAVVANFRQYVGTWADFAFEVEAISEHGADVVLDLHESGRGRASGVPFEHRYAQVWRFRDGLIVRIESYESAARARQALGLEAE